MSDELERTLRESLTRHAAPLGRPAGEIDTVYERVTHRRQRRRAVAGVGSLAIAVVGVVGIATVGQDGGGGARVADGIGDAAPGEGQVWGCTGYLGGDGVTTYYADCGVVDASAVTAPCAQFTPAPTMTTVVLGSTPTTTLFPGLDPQPLSSEYPPMGTVLLGQGETLKELASKAGISPEQLAEYNGWIDGADVQLEPGNSVLLPPEGFATATTLLPTAPTPSTPCVNEVLTAPPTIPVPVCPWPTSQTVSECAFAPQEQRYVVVEGDSIYSIAALFDIDPTILVNYNSWPEGIDHPIFVGDVVMIPPFGPAGETYPYLTDTAPATTAVVLDPVETTSPPPTTAAV